MSCVPLSLFFFASLIYVLTWKDRHRLAVAALALFFVVFGVASIRVVLL